MTNGKETPELGFRDKSGNKAHRRHDSLEDKRPGSKSRFALGSSKDVNRGDINYSSSEGSTFRKDGRHSGRKSPNFGTKYEDERLETFGRGDNREKERRISGSQYGGQSEIVRRRPKRPVSGKSKKRYDKGRDDRSKSGNRSIRSRPADSNLAPRSRKGASTTSDPRFEKHISSKLSKKAYRAPKFDKNKYQREKTWMLDYKSHRPIHYDAEILEQPAKETMSYVIILEKVSGIPKDSIPELKQKNVAATLNYSCTLYDEDSRQFFGRTYTSKPIKLDDNFVNTADRAREFIFMHTSHKSLTMCLAVECFLEIVELGDKKNTTHNISIGYTLYKMFGSAKGQVRETQLPIYLGSPRMLVMRVPFSAPTVSTCRLTAQIKEYPIFNKLKKLVPSTTLCGMFDMVPGIIGNKLSLKKDGLKICPETDVVINNIRIKANPSFERKFKDFLGDFIFEKYKTSDEISPQETMKRLGRPMIMERKISIDFDNTWKSSGNKSFTSLNPQLSSGLYNATGYTKISNFLLDPDIALTFKLEFRLEMPAGEPIEKSPEKTKSKRKKSTNPTRKDSTFSHRKETAYFTIGWGYYLPDYNSNGEILPGAIRTVLTLGPGTAPDGSILWTPKQEDRDLYQFRLDADFTPMALFDEEKTMGEKERIKRPDINVKKFSPRSPEKVRPAPALDKKELDKLKKQEEEIKNLKEQLYSQAGSNLRTEQSDSRYYHDEVKNVSRDLEEKYQDRLKKIEREMQIKNEKLERELRRKQKGGKARPSSRSPRAKEEKERPIGYSPGGYPTQLPYASNYYADPHYSMHPSFYPPDDKGRLIGHSRRMDEDLSIIPPPPLVPIELPTTFDISREDEIAFVKLGIKEDILRTGPHEKPELDIELQNELKASEFTFRFIAFKPPLAMPFGQNVPRKMYFKFNFFTFSQTVTDVCSIRDPEGRSELTRALIPGQQYILERLGKHQEMGNYRSVEKEFSVDASISKIHEENVQFYKYLLERELSIDIYDADSHLHYGTCRVNLRNMLKQSRAGIVRARDCEIAAFEASNRSITGAVNMGHIQILMSHQGKKEAEVSHFNKDEVEDSNKFLEERKQPSQKHKFNKKINSNPVKAFYEECVANRPDDLYERAMEKPFQIENEESEDVRKKMRIERAKQRRFKQTVMEDTEAKLRHAKRREEIINLVSDPNQPEWLKKHSLQQIETMRDYTKPQVIDQVLKNHIKSMKHLHVVPGTPSFFKYTLRNPFTTKTVFTVNMIDPDKIFLGDSKEFSLINNERGEWEFWYRKRECEGPMYWDMVNSRDEIMLAPGESCPLLFKFITYREFDPHKNSSQLHIKERSIQILFEYSSISEGKGQMFETQLVVTPRNPPIDFSITFSEPPNSHASLTIPANFYTDPYKAYCSNPNVICEFDAQKRLVAELKTPDEAYNNPKAFYVYIYNEEFNAGLQCCLRIVVESVFCVYTKSRVGLKMDQTLTMEGDKSRDVILYSSNSRIVETHGDVQKLRPNTYNVLNVSVRTYERDYKKVRINCVDVFTKELVKSWLMLVESEEPKVTRTIDVNLVIDRGVTQGIDFENKLNKKAVFEFATTRPDLCKPVNKHSLVNAREIKRIDLFFPPKRLKGRGECLLFINDEEYNFYECYRLKLKYIA